MDYDNYVNRYLRSMGNSFDRAGTNLTYLVGGSSWEYFPSQTGQHTPRESSAEEECSRTGNRRSFIT